MRARPDEQKRLLDLQALDNRVGQLVHSRRTLPQAALLETLTRDADALRRRTTEARGVHEDASIELRRVESDVAVVEARIARDNARLQQVTSAKDAQGLEHELTSLSGRKADLEDIQLAVMERVDEARATVTELESERATLTERIAELERERDAALAVLDEETAAVTANRATVVAGLPADLVELYEKQRARYGVGAALLRRGISGGSNVALNASDLAMVRAADPDEVVLDPESGCILVRTEESGL
ncbi:hypothetical protein DDQ50_10860 [Amnibacterium flavum]|uniref:CT398-like coiled coil hairpin domain-containing protein n=1 Tax=Amnibacterium flavum TaxID=2173173 RepID=A0A2V1HNY8_9MICO|nr:hypothetical protein DDQ50_10860 [Amnibacterium flavum]